MSGRHAPNGGCAVVYSALCLLFVFLAASTSAAPSPTPGAVPALLSPRHWALSPSSPASDAAHVRAPAEHLELLRTALVACTDGSLHGVDRHTGAVRWSLGCGAPWPDTSSGSMGQQEECLPFRPVVSASYGPDRITLSQMLAQANDTELSIYLVEPTAQGELYALTGSPRALRAYASASGCPASPASSDNGALPATLAKLPLTLPQLVSLSPFTFSGDDSRVFVGSKQARLVEVNVRTGAIRSMYGATSVSGMADAGEWEWSAPKSPSQEKDQDDTDDDVWALIGRTDYTLAIHAKHGPNLTQTLHLSLYSPNLADRDVLAAWRTQHYPDPRRILVLPDEGSLVCLNTSATASDSTPLPAEADPKLDSDEQSAREDARTSRQTIWRTEMGASVASVFDFVQPNPNAKGDGVEEQLAVTSRRPVLVPHPALQPEDIFRAPDQAGLHRDAEPTPDLGGNTYVGASEGSLYAMSSVRYPLAALGQPAPASHPSECHDLQCMVGSYQTERPAGWAGSLDPSFPHSQWFDTPLGFNGPASNPWDAHRVSTIDPPTAAPLMPPMWHPAAPKASQTAVSSAPATNWFVSAALGLMAMALVVLLPYVRGKKPFYPASARPTSTSSILTPDKASNPDLPVEQPSSRNPTGTLHPEEARVGDADAALKAGPTSLPVPRPCGQRSSPGASSASAASATGVPIVVEQQRSPPDGPGATSPTQPGSSPPAPKPKKKRRGKRAGQQVAAKAARAERLAAAEAEVMRHQFSLEDGYFTNSTPDASEPALEDKPAAAGQDSVEMLSPDPMNGDVTVDSVNFAVEPPHLVSTEDLSQQRPFFDGIPQGSPTNPFHPELARTAPRAAVAGMHDGDVALEGPLRDLEAHMVEEHLFALEGKGQVLHASAPATRGSSLVISDEVLGYGSSGTVVFKGSFQGRAVAVKRLLKDFTSIASKEVHLLESADDHPNVVRYYYQEVTDSFLYIALELCQASLADVVEHVGPGPYQELKALLQPKLALEQIAQGLQHLHGLSIVHRDLKPHNILVTICPPARSAAYTQPASRRPRLKMLLSDFGLSKRLDGLAQSSFSQTFNHPAGTVGWRAPEILRGEVSLESGAESTDGSEELKPACMMARAERGEERRRLTRAVDLFSFGCIAYYVLSRGQHPFGSRFVRELNVLRGEHDLGSLAELGEEGHEARHLILGCICAEPARRPSASEVLLHPYFWTPHKRLQFLLQSSDAFDTLERVPPSPVLLALERRSVDVLGPMGWTARVDPLFVADLGKFRSYDPKRVQDLLRAMRNKAHHYQDMSLRLQQLLGTLPDQFLLYFTTLFPKLFLHVYTVLCHQPSLRSEPRFRLLLEGDGEHA